MTTLEPETDGIPSSVDKLSSDQPVDVGSLTNYIRSVVITLLEGTDIDLDASIGEKYNVRKSIQRTCSAFANDANPLVLFVLKDKVDDNDEDSQFLYRVDTKLSVANNTVGSLAIIKKPNFLDNTISLTSQLQTVTLPSSQAKNADESPYEVLHSILHFAIAPYFDAFCKSTKQTSTNGTGPETELGVIPSTRKKISELELSLLHLQQNIEIPELILDLNPVIQRALRDHGESKTLVPAEVIPSETLTDITFLNSLQSNVNSWVKSIQATTRISRDPSSGTATQEINFWLSMEMALKNIEDQLESPGVLLTLAVLKHAKRFHATMSFISDTGIKESSETVAKYNQLMRDFPLDELNSATGLTKVQNAVVQIFSHLNRKLRVTPYPVWRCLALVEAISGDLDTVIKNLINSKKPMQIDFDSLNSIIKQIFDIFVTWDDYIKEFTNVAREVTRKRSEKFIPIRITARHLKTKERLEYILGFRARHEELRRTLTKVISSQGKINDQLEGVNPLEEISGAYNALNDVNVLETSEDGVTNWNNAEKIYNDRTARVEQAIIALLRDRLAVAKQSNEMFRVFSKFNALFVRPAIRGAIQEYQARLIDNVKVDISALHDRFRQQYTNSEAHEMFKLHDLPAVSGTIVWIRQIENQLETYMKRVEDVLGKGWQMYAEGQKLHAESASFLKSLDTVSIYNNWLSVVSKRNLAITGHIFKVNRIRKHDGYRYELAVNFDPQVITLFKEVRNLFWLNFQVPHSISSVSKDAKRVYPVAVCLIETLHAHSQTLIRAQEFSESSILLESYGNDVLSLVSKGMAMKWESFVHSFDLKSSGLDRHKGKNESGHARFVYDLDSSVSTLMQKTEMMMKICSAINQLLDDLIECSYDRAAFSLILDAIQENVDKLSLESFSNIQEFVNLINSKVQNVLATRCNEKLVLWCVSFESLDKVNGLATPIQIITHELGLKNQMIVLNPPIETTRIRLLKNLQENVQSVCGLSKIVADRFNANKQPGGFTRTYNEVALFACKNIIQAYNITDDYIRRAESYLDKWYQFQSLWDLDAKRVFDTLGNDMERWLQTMNEIRKERSTFDTTDNAKYFGIIKIDFQSVQARINSKYDSWQHDIIYKFSELLNEQMKDICSDLETARRDLEKLHLDVSSTDNIVACVTTVENYKTNLDDWEANVTLFRSGQTTLSRYRFQFPSNWLFIDQIDNEWAAMREILEAKNRLVSEQLDTIKAKVEAEITWLMERVHNLEDQWSQEKPVSGFIEPGEALRTLSRFEAATSSISVSSALLQKAAQALEIEFLGDIGLDSVVEEISDFNSVWGALDSVWKSLNDLREIPWTTVVPRKIRQSLEDCVQTTKNMPTRIRQYSAFERVQNVLKDLIKANASLVELKSEAIQERHWSSLFKQLLPSRKLFYPALMLGDVWDLKLTVNTKIVQDVIAIAQGEVALESFLKQVKETWTYYTLELVNYQNTCRLIKNWDDLFQKCGDHLNFLTAMHHSPYFKVFEEEARGWEDKLNRIHALFDCWIDVQRQWVYLEGVFSNNNEIKHVLPVESSRFQNINSEFFVILRKVYKSPLVLDVLNIQGIQSSIERLLDLLTRVQRALGEYFEKERQKFGRLYFIGDEDLLEIIGNSSDVARLEKHLKKLFAGIDGLLYDSDNSMISGVRSREGEELLLGSTISLAKFSKAVDLLVKLEEETKLSISANLKSSVVDFKKLMSGDITEESYLNWIQQYPAQVLVLSSQVHWTFTVNDALANVRSQLSSLRGKTTLLLELLAGLVLKDLSVVNRRKCEALVTELIHQRDIISQLIDERVKDADDFLWLSQLTYHFDPDKKPLERLVVKQSNATFTYGFEYLGVPDRIVYTPLIDRCFLTMTQALDQKLGGSPFGPAGTGKTEAMKALGQALGKFVLVFCCDESFDFQAIGRILLGICQIGAWGCFDEFNRLNEKILSAVSSLIERIEVSLRSYKENNGMEVELVGRTLKVNEDTGIFITMNPEYSGRNALPENLKRLFRSFSMARPDREVIADVVLNSRGFVHSTALAKVIVPFFAELEGRLSSQIHYDFGLRALKNVLSSSGALKRKSLGVVGVGNERLHEWEAGLILQSLKDTVSPKLIPGDAKIMVDVESQYFPGIKLPASDVQDLQAAVSELACQGGLVVSEQWLDKVMQLYRFQQIHHGIMLVGSSGSGKTRMYKTLLDALEKIEQIESVSYLIDAKVMTKVALYGTLDPTTREWTDGLLTSILRKIVDNLRGEDQKRHWIIFDGDVDPEWIENLNSVLDDNKSLTLPNGERIPLTENVRLIFEVENLDYATPATVSRCGMIWFGDHIVTPSMLLQSHLHELRQAHFDDLEESVGSFNNVSVETVLNEASTIVADAFDGTLLDGTDISTIIEKAANFAHTMTFSVSRSLGTFFTLVKSACLQLLTFNSQNSDFPPSVQQRKEFLTKKTVLSLLWAFSGDCSLEDRLKFSQFIAALPRFVGFCPTGPESLLDYEVLLPDGKWSLVFDNVPKIELETHSITLGDVVVPTVDTVRHEALIYDLLNDHKPAILCGPPGSGKTMTLFAALRSSPNLDVVGLNFSKATTPQLLIKSIEQYCDYRKTANGIFLSPTQIGRWLVVFCDEINLPSKDKYGTQHVISLLRQMIEQNGFWNEKGKQWVTLSNIQFVGACNPPSDVGRNELNMRFLRHAAVIYVDYPGEVSLKQIYRTFNSTILKCIPSLRGYGEDLTEAMVDFYLKSREKFNVKTQSHYVYSPRELTRWSRGIYEAIRPLESLSLEGLVRIWAHEALRLFHDRLVGVEEKAWTQSMVNTITSKYFAHANLEIALKSPILYSNWLTKEYLPVEREELKRFVNARVGTFCEEELDTKLVLYDDLLDHVLRIDRVLRQPQGHLILIGVSGSGKTTLSRFVAWMNGLKTYQLKTTRKYGQQEFDDDLRSILRQAGCSGQKLCFILDESNILESSFLERMNTLLANGEVPGLFEGDDYTTLMTACKEGALRQGLNLDTEDELYKWFTGEIIRNLHVIFTMNPPDTDLSPRAVASPALFNRCVLNWMGDWSDFAKYQVAMQLIERTSLDRSEFQIPETAVSTSYDLPTPKSFRDVISHLMVRAHNAVVDFRKGLKGSMESRVMTTPGDYLDFIEHFVNIFDEKKEELEEQQRHLNVGLTKLRETVIVVKDMRANLAEKKIQLEAKSQEAKEMLRQMVTNQNEAERKREASIEIQHALDIQEKEISNRKEIVFRDLARAEPAVQEAQKSVSNIKKQHLTELRSMMNPPDAVKLALESVCSLLGHRIGTWKEIQTFIRRDDFISSIVNFNNETQMTPQLRSRMERDYLSLPSFNYETVNRASKACGPLLQWVIAQVDYSAILERVGPLREELAGLEQGAMQTRAQAQAIAEMIDELETSIERYKDDYAVLITDTQNIKNEMVLVENKVERSIKLIESLSAEKERWSSSIREFEVRTNSLPGNVLLNSAFIAYAGFFDQQVRQHLFNSWTIHAEELGVPLDRFAVVTNYLTSGEQKLAWHENALPVDDLCVENAAMTQRSIRYPFIIDPTARVVEFLKREYSNGKLTVTSFLDNSFIKHLESALRFGNPILIQDAEHLDPIINQVLNKEYKRTGGRTLITLGKQEIDFSKDFQLYLLTKDPTVVVPPHISCRTTIVNYSITRSSLESQTLNHVLGVERPDVEEKHQKEIKLQGEYKVHLKQLEVTLLQALSQSEGSILDNDKIIDGLERIKVEALEVAEKVKGTEFVMQTIELVMSQYRPIARHCGEIFSILERLYMLNNFYQFSFDFFMSIFKSLLNNNKPEAITAEDEVNGRVRQLTRKLYLESYRRVAPTLTEADKVLLVFLLSQGYTSELDIDLYRGLLMKSSISISMDESGWMEKVASIFRGFSLQILVDGIKEDELAARLRLDNPENEVPDIWGDIVKDEPKLFYKLIFLKLVRPERFVFMVESISKKIFGQSMLYGEAEELNEIVNKDVNCYMPIALAATSGNDPTFKVEQLAERTESKCEILSMGSSEGKLNADKAVQLASQNGTWVLLQNVHLSPEWLEIIEKRLQTMRMHPGFRLFFTTNANARIPATLLRMSRVLMVESPPGIKSSMQSSLSDISAEQIAKAPVERGRLYYLLSWVHGIIQERMRFGSLGWSKPYDFNESDYESGLFVIDKWIDGLAKSRSNISPSAIPWKALQVLIAETIYGGKIDKPKDESIVVDLVNRVFTADAYNIGFQLVDGVDGTNVPEGSSFNDFMKWVASLPEREPPTWLGLSENADEQMLALEGAQIVKNSIRVIESIHDSL